MLSVSVAQAGFLDQLAADVQGAAENIERDLLNVDEEAVSNAKAEAGPENERLLGHVWETARVEWGQNFNPDKVEISYEDFTCDGQKDYIARHISYDNPDVVTFGMILTTEDGGKAISETVNLSFNGAQDGLCVPAGDGGYSVDVSVEHWDESQVEAVFGSWQGICTEAIRVDDGMCDAPRYFWLIGDGFDPEQTRLMSHRN